MALHTVQNILSCLELRVCFFRPTWWMSNSFGNSLPPSLPTSFLCRIRVIVSDNFCNFGTQKIWCFHPLYAVTGQIYRGEKGSSVCTSLSSALLSFWTTISVTFNVNMRVQHCECPLYDGWLSTVQNNYRNLISNIVVQHNVQNRTSSVQA